MTINKLLNYSQLYFHAWALVKRARVSFPYSLKIIRLFYVKLPQATKDHLSQVIGRNDIGINILQKKRPSGVQKIGNSYVINLTSLSSCSQYVKK